ncbi:MAG: TldD/PmbA family protein [Thermoanaerobaculia bacterium]
MEIATRGEAEAVVERALRAAGTDEADASCVITDRSLTRFATSRIHQNLAERSAVLTVRIVDGGRLGVASTSSLDDEAIRTAVALARELARRSEPLPSFHGFHRTAPRAAAGAAWDEATARVTPREKAETLRSMFRTGEAAGVRYAGAWSTCAIGVAVGNVHGVRQAAPLTSAEIAVIALADGGSGYATGRARRARDLDPVALADEAARKATLLAGAGTTLEPGVYPVILEPPALAEIFEWMNTITFSGRSYEDGSSFFVGALGERVLGENFSLADDATDPSFLPFPFDMEGLPKRRVDLIERGVLRTPLLDKIAADRTGLPPTASAASLTGDDRGVALHLAMTAGDASVDDLIAGTERGIYVTRFHYLNGLLDPKVGMMTGMTRDGTFLVQDGRLAARLPNLRWTQAMTEALANIEAIGRERRIVGSFWNSLGGTLAPAVKIGAWRITGSTG